MNAYKMMDLVRLVELFEKVIIDEVDGTGVYSVFERVQVKEAYREMVL